MKRIFILVAFLLVFLMPSKAEALTLPSFLIALPQRPEQNILVITNLIRPKNDVRIDFLNLKDVLKINYTLTYNANNIPQGVSGSLNINGENKIIKDIFLGTCSARSCVFHNPKNIKLEVKTQYKSGKIITTNYSIN